MLVLDADHVSILQQQSRPAYHILQARLVSHPPAEVCNSIISFHEQVQGWLAYLNRARTSEQIGHCYAKLELLLRYYAAANVGPFNETAQAHFAELKRRKVRIGTMDLRIASIALAASATLLSRNLRDFRQVPGLAVEDWTR